ncbi:MFS transporter [Amycolatopsis sp. MtRt-6]|uniref:MFS transporter n=1 Tax=Amycolatopsis sp. MtRt-6 TaxID=2792782 RepID=UPI001A8DC0B0|nr:MFS transporter [Amycolatopsis sp. MtRt-6]
MVQRVEGLPPPAATGAVPALSRRRRFATIAALYLVADIGYSFFFGALNTILLQGGTHLGQVALINLLGLLYVGRFLLGPLVDRVRFGWLGHYRGWLVITQLVLVVVWLTLVPLDPVGDLPVVLALMAVGLAVSAVHDTAMNGLAVRLLPPRDRGLGNGIQTGMASVSIMLGSGGALLLYSHAGWSVTISVLAALFLVPFGVLLFMTEPADGQPARRELPFAELVTLFRQRRVRTWTLLVVPVFALGGYVATAVQAPMMLAAHWSLERIALVQSTLSGLVGLAAGFGAGALVTRLGRRRSALAVGVFWVFALASLLPLSLGGSTAAVDAAAVLAVSVGYSGMAVCVSTVSMDLARPASAATDFTLQISVLGVLRLAMSSAGLAVAGTAGFPPLIGASVLLAAAGTWITARWLRGHHVSSDSLDTPREFA